MYLINHVGDCCGVKVIFKLGPRPSCNLFALPACEAIEGRESRQVRYFWKAAPSEAAEERFKRYVEFWNKNTKYGLLEVYVADATAYGVDKDEEHWANQYYHWKNVLKKHGFKMVTSTKNSNSGNRIFVFHKVKDVPKPIKEKGK